MKEIIDNYQPELLYSDGRVPFGEKNGYDIGLEAIAHLYNASAARNGGVNQAIYNQKDRRPDDLPVGIMDIERSQEPDIKPEPWQTDTSVGDWFYNVRDVYKTAGHVVEMLVDIVSKNGNLLLDIPQRPDGTLDEECTHILTSMGVDRPCAARASTAPGPIGCPARASARFTSRASARMRSKWASTDFRFTRKGDTLYAFQMRWPDDGRTVIHSLRPDDRARSVRLLGGGEVSFEQAGGVLVAQLPDHRPVDEVNCLAIEFDHLNQ